MASPRELIERNLETWNEHDRDGWAADFARDAELSGPGGVSGSGPEMAGAFYDVWHDAFPDNQIDSVTIAEDRQTCVLEALFRGTHSGPLAVPAGTIEATGGRVVIPFAVVHRVQDGRIASFHLYFDQLGMLEQLGLAPVAVRG